MLETSSTDVVLEQSSQLSQNRDESDNDLPADAPTNERLDPDTYQAFGTMSLKAQAKPRKNECDPSNADVFCNLEDLGGQAVQGAPVLTAPSERKVRKKLSIIDIQPYQESEKITIMGKGNARGEVQLINLNPKVNLWYLVRIFWPHQKDHEWYHLQTISPEIQKLSLDSSFPNGIVITEGQETHSCELWASNGAEIKLASFKKKPYTLLCDEKIYLRQKIEGYRTTKEWVVEFLRDRVWGGEAITELVKNTLYKDRYLIDAKVSDTAEAATSAKRGYGIPQAAVLAPEYQSKLVQAEELGIAIKNVKPEEAVQLGEWYPAKNHSGVFISVLEAEAISEEILKSHGHYVKGLGPVEKSAVNYLIAFDMTRFDLNFAVGTEHPRVGWSGRVRKADRDLSIPGPDGFDTIEPIAPTGLIPPEIGKLVAATFTGGFKRSHGAFKWGKLSKENFGTHYGFIQNGVIFSKMQEQLATMIIYQDGRIDMKTWESSDNLNLGSIKHARQNGVPVIKFDEEALKGVPGDYVSNWTLGNWSGSQDREFRTLRAGMCLTRQGDKQFLIYGYFSSVTPTAMARIFQAYSCDYGMHLDMNALEHTYLALYPQNKSKGNVPEQLVKGMKVLDQRFKGNVPRFIGYPDNRDYFYLTPRGG
ncbi:hypothetical protein [Pseudobacteriovorax antillogorgiicola]|uniref:hypothetical protein n=1 Tax=Pseudobacteriovorax antillogorgiicola TaxID=1513793 RepID=UPI001F3D8F5E|nr:hypothetical protein [Pseudobacteriovorax antillogorgiicola]